MQVTKITEKQRSNAEIKRKPLTPEELQKEYDYSRSLKILNKMLECHLITQEEFHKIDHLNRQSFSPLYSSLMP